MIGMVYDAAGNLTDAGGGWTFTYDATGQQATSAVGSVQMFYDGDRLRGKKKENGTETYYLRSRVLGGQVVAEINQSGSWSRGYVYLGGQILAVQQSGVYWMHQDPAAKSKRVTDTSGNVVSTIEPDPWGGETNRSSNEAFQPRKFTTYERDSIGSDEAMHRRYNRWWARFEQPDPYSGSYNLGDPQSFNRYSYVQNDPVNFVDPTGLDPQDPGEPPPPPMPPGPLDVVTTDIWGSLPGAISASGLLGGDSHAQLLLVNFIFFEDASQDPSANRDTRTSCQRFADVVDEIWRDNPHLTPTDFVDRLYRRFANLRNEFSSDGFKASFQDSGGSPDQARHYIGGLSAGFAGTQWGSETVGRWIANSREYDFVVTMDTTFPLVYPVQNDSQRADQRLNAVSTRHGGALSRGEIRTLQLADFIRREVCQ